MNTFYNLMTVELPALKGFEEAYAIATLRVMRWFVAAALVAVMFAAGLAGLTYVAVKHVVTVAKMEFAVADSMRPVAAVSAPVAAAVAAETTKARLVAPVATAVAPVAAVAAETATERSEAPIKTAATIDESSATLTETLNGLKVAQLRKMAEDRAIATRVNGKRLRKAELIEALVKWV